MVHISPRIQHGINDIGSYVFKLPSNEVIPKHIMKDKFRKLKDAEEYNYYKFVQAELEEYKSTLGSVWNRAIGFIIEVQPAKFDYYLCDDGEFTWDVDDVDTEYLVIFAEYLKEEAEEVLKGA